MAFIAAIFTKRAFLQLLVTVQALAMKSIRPCRHKLFDLFNLMTWQAGTVEPFKFIHVFFGMTVGAAFETFLKEVFMTSFAAVMSCILQIWYVFTFGC